jgi:tetratricopeptide (TPR) repeat protein
MMPQGRYAEAEKFLTRAICTENAREKVNAYSNLAMVAFRLKEFTAAKRYATVGSKSNDQAIASESRLTLCQIEFQRLFESENPTESEWESLFNQVIASLEDVDFDDAAQFLEILLKICEKAPKMMNIVQVIETQYAKLIEHPDRQKNDQVSMEIEVMRVQILSQNYLKESKYLLLDGLFMEALQKLKDQNLRELVEYLRTPFAGIEIRRGALQIKNLDFLSEWAAFEQVPEILYALSKSETESVLISLAENSASPDEVCALIASKEDLDLDYALSTRTQLSTNMIQILMKSPFDSVRKSIAERSDLDDAVYTQLATDRSILVRDAVKENPNCSPEIKALAALGSL